jgi:UDP-N-acetylglucosamine 2-epimerase (non-hydrolysing)
MYMVIHLVCGARPNFMKIAPLYHRLVEQPWASPVIVHTGQHYDTAMSGSFFTDLGLPAPHIYLGVGSGSHAEQTAKVMVAYETILKEQRPDLVVVVGDVNSTMAATLAASKLHIKVAHLEAGLRSFDREMPEEINRLVTDVVADRLWVPSSDGIENLRREGIPDSKIAFVGNIMIDSLEMMRERIEAQSVYRDYRQTPNSYAVVTLHRPSNVDDPATLQSICEQLEAISQMVPLIFPVHPRTRKQILELGLLQGPRAENIRLPEPLGYISFMSLVMNCRLVITDSGGIQEETSYLGIPCLTLRENTERPITVTEGTNQLVTFANLQPRVSAVLASRLGRVPKLKFWDGQTATRIVADLAHYLGIATESRGVAEDTVQPAYARSEGGG